MPRVTVLMSVYNGAPYLRESIDSILRQSYQDVQFVIVNDGSRDASGDILASYRDPRLLVITQTNQGLAAGLNRGLREAVGEFIARQDQDDVSLPGRLQAQLQWMQRHPRVGVLGTCAELIDASGHSMGAVIQPAHAAILKWHLLFSNPLFHSSVMIRRQALDELGGYSTDPARQPPEDYELWSRLALRWELANLPAVWLKNREVIGSMTRNPQRPFHETLVKISLENLRRLNANLEERRLLELREFVTGGWSPRNPQILWRLFRDLWRLERAFCAASHLSVSDARIFAAYNRRRLIKRVRSLAASVWRRRSDQEEPVSDRLEAMAAAGAANGGCAP